MKKNQEPNFSRTVNSHYPGLVEIVKRIIEASEKEYTGKKGATESYLWEHTTHVASLGYQLAKAEKREPLLPTIAALFHDAGKFAGGRYHGHEMAEEEDAASLAESVLREAGMSAGGVERITSAIRALYDEKAKKNWISDIVHDADFLAKFGTLGAAQFFIKSALRGQTLRAALMNSLSKELTYAACLPLNMRTGVGRRRARKKSRDTLKFFGSLLKELAEAGGANFAVRKILVRPSARPRKPIDVRVAVPRSCPKCGGRWRIDFKTTKGVKCEKLEGEISCGRCGSRSNFSFCLPEIHGSA